MSGSRRDLKDIQQIISQEYNEGFDNLRKRAMVNSYFKYGPKELNYSTHKCIRALDNIKKRLALYEQTGNKDYLVDIANFAALEFEYPSVEGAFYKPQATSVNELVGFGVNEVTLETELQ